MPLPRGFKTRCENLAQSVRVDLGLKASDPLPASELAAYLGVKVITPVDIPGMSGELLEVLLVDEAQGWSALTVSDSKSTLVIYNPRHSDGRQSSDVTHELAHVLLRHSPSVLMFAPDGTWALRSYDKQQEEEAGWLSGCLLLPRPALLSIARVGRSSQAAAADYGVSQVLLKYRTDMTGVTRQIRNRQ